MMRRARFEPRIYTSGHRGMVGAAILRRLKADASANLLTRTRDDLDMRAPHLRLPLGWGGGEGTIRRKAILRHPGRLGSSDDHYR